MRFFSSDGGVARFGGGWGGVKGQNILTGRFPA